MGERYDTMRRAAYDTAGRRWFRWILAWDVVRKTAPFILGAALLGGLGYFAHMAWVALTTAVRSPSAKPVTAPVADPAVHADHLLGAVPVWLWIVAAVLVIVLLWMVRPGQVTTRSERRLRAIPACALLLVIMGMAGVSLSAGIGT